MLLFHLPQEPFVFLLLALVLQPLARRDGRAVRPPRLVILEPALAQVRVRAREVHLVRGGRPRERHRALAARRAARAVQRVEGRVEAAQHDRRMAGDAHRPERGGLVDQARPPLGLAPVVQQYACNVFPAPGVLEGMLPAGLELRRGGADGRWGGAEHG